MKKINTLTMMILLTYSFSIAQELEVQGDLIVTGTIESATIDSMQAVIDSLEADMASMHGDNQLETRVYEYNISLQENELYDFTLSDITNGDLDNSQNAILFLLNADNIVIENTNNLYLRVQWDWDQENFAKKSLKTFAEKNQRKFSQKKSWQIFAENSHKKNRRKNSQKNAGKFARNSSQKFFAGKFTENSPKIYAEKSHRKFP